MVNSVSRLQMRITRPSSNTFQENEVLKTGLAWSAMSMTFRVVFPKFSPRSHTCTIYPNTKGTFSMGHVNKQINNLPHAFHKSWYKRVEYHGLAFYWLKNDTCLSVGLPLYLFQDFGTFIIQSPALIGGTNRWMEFLQLMCLRRHWDLRCFDGGKCLISITLYYT